MIRANKPVSREELVVSLSAQILALPDDAPRAVALTGMGCTGKTMLAADLVPVVTGAGRPLVTLAYDGFHHPSERRHRQGRTSAVGYLDDSFDPAALRRLVLDPLAAGARGTGSGRTVRSVARSYDAGMTAAAPAATGSSTRRRSAAGSNESSR